MCEFLRSLLMRLWVWQPCHLPDDVRILVGSLQTRAGDRPTSSCSHHLYPTEVLYRTRCEFLSYFIDEALDLAPVRILVGWLQSRAGDRFWNYGRHHLNRTDVLYRRSAVMRPRSAGAPRPLGRLIGTHGPPRASIGTHRGTGVPSTTQPKKQIRDPGSGIRDPGSRIRDPGCC